MANKLKNMTIGEVSFCRKGMNQHAKVALFKAQPDASPLAIAKATFAEALEGSMIAGAVNEAFYRAFDGLWERNEAFRTALTDELAAGGDGTTASAAYKASVHDLVDEAVADARKAGVTAGDTTDIEKVLTATADRWLMAKKEQTTMKITNKAELQTAISGFALATSTVSDARDIQKAAKDLNLEDLLPADLAPPQQDPALAKALNEIAVLKMDGETRSYYDGLADDAKVAFLAKSEDDQKADVAKANETDPVVYTGKDGTVIRKSDGPAAAAMAKRLDDQAALIGKLQGDLSGTTIEARAAREFPNVAKAVAVDMLKSVDSLGGESEAGKAILKSLETMNSGGGRLFKSLGTSEDNGPSGDEQSARAEFDAEVEKAVADQKIDRTSAMSKVRAAKPDLFAKAYPDTVAAAEESAEIARSHTN